MLMFVRSALAAAGKTYRTENISERIQKIVISPIKEMSILADMVVQETGADIVSLGQGIPHFDTPDHIKDAISRALLSDETAKYTLEPGINELRNLIARHLMLDKGATSVEGCKEIMIGVGCQEIVACALASILDEGDEVLIPSPGFASHSEQVVQFGGTPVFFQLNEEKGWALDIAECERCISEKTKAILFSNPSNPTGAVLTAQELEALGACAKKHNLIIIADETYDFLTYDSAVHVSFASFPQFHDRTIVAGSFSKKYAMTGYRVGYGFAEEGIIDHMLKTHDALAICAPAISQKAAIQALTGPQDNVAYFVKGFTENRSSMMKRLDALSSHFSYHAPKGAYYIFVRYTMPGIDSFNLSLRLLREAHVITIPGAAFGPTGEGCLRFSFAGKPALIDEAFNRIEQWLKRNI